MRLSKSKHVHVAPSQDGRLCVHDLTSHQLAHTCSLSDSEAVAAVAFHPTRTSTLYAAVGRKVLQLDVRKGCSEPVACGSSNEDDVSSIAVHQSGGYLAAADDAGDTQLYNLQTADTLHPMRKLRHVHSSLASSVAFRPHKPWELVTGGLDCRVTKWDFSRGKCLGAWSMQDEGEQGGAGGTSQMYNPPFVHCIAVSTTANSPVVKRACAAARGDGVVAVFDIDAANPGTQKQTKGTSNNIGSAVKSGTQKDSTRCSPVNGSRVDVQPGFNVLLGADAGGHTRPVSSCCFLHNGAGRYLASGGEDKRLVVWNWQQQYHAQRQSEAGNPDQVQHMAGEAEQQQPAVNGESSASGPFGSSGNAGVFSSANQGGPMDVIAWQQYHGFKINALCSMPQGSHAESLFVADTSDKISLYMII